jgi:hypothetical protein
MAKRGPKTDAGRLAVRHNAWKHGIRSDPMIIPNFENLSDWEAHRDGVFDSLQPQGHLEYMLAERIAIALWKLRRLEWVQMTETVKHMADAEHDLQVAQAYKERTLSKGEFPDIPEDEVNFEQSGRMIPTDLVLPRLLRYETHYHRQYIQTLHELEAMQIRREGGATPLARLDITGAPDG